MIMAEGEDEAVDRVCCECVGGGRGVRYAKRVGGTPLFAYTNQEILNSF